jgi:hypothetical protein
LILGNSVLHCSTSVAITFKSALAEILRLGAVIFDISSPIILPSEHGFPDKTSLFLRIASDLLDPPSCQAGKCALVAWFERFIRKTKSDGDQSAGSPDH